MYSSQSVTITVKPDSVKKKSLAGFSKPGYATVLKSLIQSRDFCEMQAPEPTGRRQDLVALCNFLRGVRLGARGLAHVWV